MPVSKVPCDSSYQPRLQESDVMLTVLYLGIVNWMATVIITESVIFEDFRDMVRRYGKSLEANHPRIGRKVCYFVTCALCMGTWIGFIEAIVFDGPLRFWWLSFIANGLLYKGIGHLFLQLNALAHHMVTRLNAESVTLN